GHGISFLSIPFVGFTGGLEIALSLGLWLSIPFVGFRYYYFFFWFKKVFPMMNCNTIMAQIKLALN
ncbi:MAG: hypothetical protein QW481_07170, partial [Candidatus Methanomethylicia archaeon]